MYPPGPPVNNVARSEGASGMSWLKLGQIGNESWRFKKPRLTTSSTEAHWTPKSPRPSNPDQLRWGDPGTSAQGSRGLTFNAIRGLTLNAI